MYKVCGIIIFICICYNSLLGKLLFDTTVIEDTIVQDIEFYKFKFRFKNISDTPIKIIDIEKTCNCIVLSNKNNTYNKNEVGFIEGSLYVGDRKGVQSKQIVINTDNFLQPQIKLKLNITVFEPYELKPRLILWKKGSEIKTHNVQLIIRSSNWELSNIFYPKNLFSVKYTKKDSLYKIEVTPLSTKERIRDIIKIKLNSDKGEDKILIVHLLIK